MKRIYLFLLAMTLILPAMGQNKMRIAVFDPTSSGTAIDEGTKIAIREIISSTIVNIGKHDIVERSLLEKVMQEQQFSQSGVVDDSQITEIGKLAGANKVIVSVVTLTGGRNMLSVKMIDVKTASVESQKVKVVKSGELIDVVEPMTSELIGESVTSNANAKNVNNTPTQENKEPQKPQPIRKRSVAQYDVDTKPAEGEYVIYLAPGFEPINEEDANNTISVYIDKELVGSGTISDGLYFKLYEPEKTKKNSKHWGEHEMRIEVQNQRGGLRGAVIGGSSSETTKMEIDTKKKRYYEFQIQSERKGGVNKYSIVLKKAY